MTSIVDIFKEKNSEPPKNEKTQAIEMDLIPNIDTKEVITIIEKLIDQGLKPEENLYESSEALLFRKPKVRSAFIEFSLVLPVFNRIWFKQNNVHTLLQAILNKKNQSSDFHFYIESNANQDGQLLAKFSLYYDQDQKDTIRENIENFLRKKIQDFQQDQQSIYDILNQEEKLQLILINNEQLKQQIDELNKFNLKQEMQSQPSQIGKKHYFVKDIQIVQKQSKLITFQYEGDNSLFQSQYQGVQLNEKFANQAEKFQRLCQFASEPIRYFVSYGMEQHSNMAYLFSDSSQNLEGFISKGNIALKPLIEIIICITKGLQLLHQQNLYYGKLHTQSIYVDKKSSQAKLDILYNFVERADQNQKQQQEQKIDNNEEREPNQFAVDIQNLGKLIKYLLIQNVIYLPQVEVYFVNLFEKYIMDIIEKCQIQNQSQIKLEGLVQWLNKFSQVFETYTEISNSK